MIISTLVTIYFWLFLVFVVSGLVLLTFYTVVMSTSRNRKFSHLKDWLPGLLQHGYEGSYLSLTDKRTGRTIKIHKYIWGKGDYGLEFRILESEWIESARRKLESLVEERGIERRLGPRRTEQAGHGAPVCDFGQDTEAAWDFAVAIWTEVYDLTPKTPFIYDQDEWALAGELIDGPDHDIPLAKLSPEQRGKEQTRRLEKTGVSSLTVLYIGLVVLTLIVSAIAAPISFLLARGQAPDWSLEFDWLSLGGSTASLVWFTILCASFLATQHASRRLDRKSGRSKALWPLWAWGTRRALQFFFLGLPVATFLAWAGF